MSGTLFAGDSLHGRLGSGTGAGAFFSAVDKYLLSFLGGNRYNRIIMKHTYSAVTVGALLVALSALGYSTNPILGKVAYQAGANAITLGSIRFTTAAAALWVWLLLAGGLSAVVRLKRLQLLLLGGCGMAVVALLYFTALEHMNASLATGLFYTYPAMVTIVARLRGEPLSVLDYTGLVLSGAGTWLVLGSGAGGFTWQGAVLILGAAALYSAYILVGEQWSQGVAPIVVSAHVTAGASLVYLTIALLTGQSFPTHPAAYLGGAGLALLSTIVALVTFFAGLPKVGPARASIISTLEPVFTTLLAVVVLNESLNRAQTLGIGLVVVGAVAAQLRTNKPAKPVAAPQQL